MEFSSYPLVFITLLVLVAESSAKIGIKNSDDENLDVNSTQQQQCEDICLQKVREKFDYLIKYKCIKPSITQNKSIYLTTYVKTIQISLYYFYNCIVKLHIR